MSFLYGEMIGSTGRPVTRCAHYEIVAHIRGWHFGLEARIVRTAGDILVARFNITGGSGGPMNLKEFVISEKDDLSAIELVKDRFAYPST
jgi:hypothetical protein